MPTPAPILLVGNDSSVLETRRLVLEHAGFVVHATEKPAEAKRLIAEGTVALIILCHSIPEQDTKDLLSLIGSAQSAFKTVVLLPARPTWVPDTADAVVNALDGPSALMAAVKSALHVL